MIKSFLISISFSTLLFSAQQIVLVVSEDFNTSKAYLQCYEGEKKVYDKVDVNLGQKGLGWGIGIVNIKHKANEPLKHEGDKKAPAGIFLLTTTFGYTYKALTKKMPYLYTDKNLICVDDSNDPFYNHIIEANGNEKSFEFMRRKDMQYKYGIAVAHNPKAQAQRGSCIFLHIQKAPNHPTVGCTSMREEDLKRIIKWIDKKKEPILIQVPRSYLPEVQRYYPQIRE